MLVRSGRQVAKLGDLMLAKALEGGLAQQITRPGEMLGDVRYMSPERTARGRATWTAAPTCTASGRRVYALLTGRPPFDGATLVEKITRIRQRRAGEAEEVPDGDSGPVPGRRAEAAGQAPEDRFQTATELLAELDRVAKFTNPVV